MASLFVVSTPIGNLADLSARAAATLSSVRLVMAEDTRRTGILMQHLGVSPRMRSAHAHNEAARAQDLVATLDAGDDVALVSDAGTPLLSDPGALLVAAALNAGHDVVPIPGPAAPIAALVASGLPAESFTFLGFLPRKGRERDAALEQVAASQHTTILFESPHRLQALLAALEDSCGGERKAAVARELTKLHEEIVRCPLADLARHFTAHPPRGEIVVVVAPAPAGADATSPLDEAAEEAALLLAQALSRRGLRKREIARELQRRLRLSRNTAYALAQSAGADAAPGE